LRKTGQLYFRFFFFGLTIAFSALLRAAETPRAAPDSKQGFFFFFFSGSSVFLQVGSPKRTPRGHRFNDGLENVRGPFFIISFFFLRRGFVFPPPKKEVRLRFHPLAAFLLPFGGQDDCCSFFSFCAVVSQNSSFDASRSGQEIQSFDFGRVPDTGPQGAGDMIAFSVEVLPPTSPIFLGRFLARSPGCFDRFSVAA